MKRVSLKLDGLTISGQQILAFFPALAIGAAFGPLIAEREGTTATSPATRAPTEVT